MIAAIYARKSTKDDTEDAAKSVERQVTGARAFIKHHRWALDESHI